MNVVLDTNVLIPITRWDYSLAQKVLFKLVNSNFKIFVSLDILKEFKKAIIRDFNFSEEKSRELIDKILLFADLIEITEKVDVVKEDPDDNKILECALASNSDYIIIYDNHLLKLKEFKNIKIVTPEEALKLLWKKTRKN